MDEGLGQFENRKERQSLFAAHVRAFEILDDVRMSGQEALERTEKGAHLLQAAEESDAKKTKPANADELRSFLERLTPRYIEELADDLREFLQDKIQEPVPDPRDRFEGKLESAISSPLMRLDHGRDAIAVLADVYYRLLKNHAFRNGNKKIATAFLLDAFHGHGSRFDPEALADVAMHVAASDGKEAEGTIEQLVHYIKRAS